jgi:hypothetical protein
MPARLDSAGRRIFLFGIQSAICIALLDVRSVLLLSDGLPSRMFLLITSVVIVACAVFPAIASLTRRGGKRLAACAKVTPFLAARQWFLPALGAGPVLCLPVADAAPGGTGLTRPGRR